MQADALTLRAAWQEDVRLAKLACEEESKRVLEYAKAEAEYYAEKHAEAVKMRADGEPVTHIQTIIKGVPSVNEKLQKYTISEGLYRAARDAVGVYKDAMWMSFKEYERALSENGGYE